MRKVTPRLAACGCESDAGSAHQARARHFHRLGVRAIASETHIAAGAPYVDPDPIGGTFDHYAGIIASGCAAASYVHFAGHVLYVAGVDGSGRTRTMAWNRPRADRAVPPGEAARGRRIGGIRGRAFRPAAAPTARRVQSREDCENLFAPMAAHQLAQTSRKSVVTARSRPS